MEAAAADEHEQVQVGRQIRDTRHRLDVSQSELSRRLGIDRRQLSDWERGVIKAPSIANLRRIARALGVTIDELVDPHGAD